jgi:transcriptional adapter 2-alpha
MPIPDEALLRKKIQELQLYRRCGLRTAGDIEKYESDVVKRVTHTYFKQTLEI